MAVVFVDGQAHYTTAAQANTKYALSRDEPVAGTGAFGAVGIRGNGGSWSGPPHAQYNFPASAQREFSVYLNIESPGYIYCLWTLFDNVKPQVWALLQGDGSIRIYGGAESNVSYEWQPQPGPLLGIVPAATLQYNVHSIHKVSVVHHQTTGSLTYRIDNEVVLTLTNINTAYAMSAPADASATPRSTNLRIGYAPFGVSSPGIFIGTRSHVVIADTVGDIVGNPRFGALWPEGVGAHSDFAPVGSATNWQNVDEASPNEDTDYNESETVGHIDTYVMQNVPAGLTAITAVAVTVRVKKTDANSRMFSAVLRIGGVNYVHADTKGVPGGYAYLQWIWTLNPATSAAWTVADVNALEAGVKVVS